MFTDPLKNLKMLGFRETDIVADLGAGTGFYTILVSPLVRRGKVYAVDVVKDFLKTIQNKVKEKHLTNVEILIGNVEKIGGTKIGDNIVDVAIVSNIFFEVEDKKTFIKEIKRILKKQGKVLFIDWLPDSKLVSSSLIVPKVRALEMFLEESFVLDREIDAGAHHYGMILSKYEK